MQGTNVRLEGLPDSARGPAQELGELLIKLAGDNLRCLTIFGRVLSKDYTPDGTLIRSVVVLRGMDLLLLDQLRRSGMRLGRRHLQAPLVMTPAYINESLDTFPLELLDIQQRHVTIVGDDLFADLQFDPKDMRLQAERELKSSLINLRQGLLASAGKDKLLAPLCRDALSQLLRVLRGVLWIQKTSCPASDGEVLAESEKVTGVKVPGLQEVFDGSGRSDFVSFQRFYRDVERLSDYVNHVEI